MGWSFRIARLGGTELRVHATFFLLLAWIALVNGQAGGWPAAVDGILFVLLVFACVVAHEFGHVWAAARYGIATPDVTVLPIGGLARLERMPDKPIRELAVAIAGPIVNVVIAVVLLLAVGARVDTATVAEIESAAGSLWARLAAVNLLIAVFNLIPAFPLDGGRIFRALLAMRLPRQKATLYAARIGQVFAVAFVGIGLLYNPILAVIGVFLFLAAGAETGSETARARARRLRVRDAMDRRFAYLTAADDLSRVGSLMSASDQPWFPVIDEEGRLLGWLGRRKAQEAIRRRGPFLPVAEIMEPDRRIFSESQRLADILEPLARSEDQVRGVADGRGRLVGILTPLSVNRALRPESAEEGSGRPA